MSKILAVLKREYLFRVRKRSFLIFTFLGPLLLMTVYALPVLFLTLSGTERRLALADTSGRLGAPFLDELRRLGLILEPEKEAAGEKKAGGIALARTRFTVIEAGEPGDTPRAARERLNQRLAREEFDAYLVLGADPDAEDFVVYGSRSSGDVPDGIRNGLRRPVLLERARVRGLTLDPEQITALAKDVDVTPVRVGKDGGEEAAGEAQQAAVLGVVFGMAIIFYMIFLLWGSAILRGIVEEKSRHIMEVLLSSVTPIQFMIGKVAGIGLVALTQLLVWVASALFLMLGGVATLPRIGEFTAGIHPSLFGWFVVLFLLGFGMYAVVYAAVGSMVTTTQEAEQAAMPVTFIIVASFMAMFAVQKAPDSTFAVAVSLFPLTAPLVMLMRLGITDPPWWQIGASILLQLAATAALAWGAARIFRVGVLMYGKRATIPEALRWIRAG
jgi:ABC-2 type transport system permease protein